ncbi:MAG: MG2 domain-containing protein [Sodaliphilus sp.]
MLKHTLSIIAIVLSIVCHPFSIMAENRVQTPDFDFPKEVSAKATADLDKALKAGDGILLIDALVRYGIAESVISPDNLTAIVTKMESIILKENRHDVKALLLCLEARAMHGYATAHAKRRNTPEGERPADYTEWSYQDFQDKVKELLTQALRPADELRQFPISNYSKILKFNDLGALYCPTLYDFVLAEKEQLSSLSTAEREDEEKFLLENGHIPAYLYAKHDLLSDAEKVKLYYQYSSNEHAGCLLDFLSYNTESYQALRHYAEQFPNGIYAYSVKCAISAIERKNAQLSYASSANSRDSIAISCTSKNVSLYTVSIYKVPDSYFNSLSKSKSSTISLKKCQLMASRQERIEQNLPHFQNFTKVSKFSSLPHGRYVGVVSFDAEGESVVSTVNTDDIITVHDITSFTLACENEEAKVFAIDRTTGAPIRGVTVKGKYMEGVTNANGFCTLPANISQDRVSLEKGSDTYGPTIYVNQLNNYSKESASHITLFTDLGIYRPGETVKFAGVLYRTGSTARTVVSGVSVTADLLDANAKKVHSIKLVSDAFGRVEGEFTIPTDRMNGNWSIKCTGNGFFARKNVTVSEYKTPTFAIEFPDAKTNFVSRQPVHISGIATTYSGMPIANTEVKLTLTQQRWSWYWRYENATGTTMNDTTVTTDSEGRFAITYPADKFPDILGKSIWNWNSYAVNARITTDAGESREARHAFVVGRLRSIQISDFSHENSTKATLPVEFHSSDDADRQLVCTYTLTNASGKVVKASSFTINQPEADFSDVPSGVYTIEAQVADEPDLKSKAQAIIYRKTDKAAPGTDVALWIPEDSYQVDNKNVAHALIGVSAPESHIYYVARSREKVLKQGWLHYRPGLHPFSFPIPDKVDEVVEIEFLTTYKDELKTYTHLFKSITNEQRLTVKWNTFRNKLVPGEKEKWTLQFVDQNGKPMQGAMMLEAYDKALESLCSNKWKLSAPYTWVYRHSFNYWRSAYRAWVEASFSREVKGNGFEAELPCFNLYDWNFFSIGMNNEIKAYGRVFTSVESASMPKRSAKATAKRSAKATAKPTANVAMVKDEMAEMEDVEEQPSLENIKLREADVKTALWMPMLTSDVNGELSVEFEAPEFCTTWLLQAIAYTPNMVSTGVNKEIITQKPIMVKSSLPRFVRTGDTATLKANVMNVTEEATPFNAIIEIFNPRTQEVMLSKSFAGNLGAKSTEVVAVEYSVSDTIPFVGFRVKAANAKFGDGEQVMLPVLSNIAPVVETQPFFIDAKQQQFEMTMPQFPLDSRVTLEYANNPVWYCVSALPTIYSPNYHIATNLAHNLFAEVLAQGVAKSHPLIKSAIEQWRADEHDSTLVSMLSKNADLKIGSLLDSPWVNEAERQSMRMQKLITLFDEKQMSQEHKKIVEALQKLQRADGGFPWYDYPGCKSNLRTTETVLQLIGELHHLGYALNDADISPMEKKALAYYDKEMLELWNFQQKYNKKNYSGFSSYVYVRSLFPNVELPKANQKMLSKALSAMRKDWKGLSLSEKAYYALALHRNGYTKDAQLIVESLRQFALIKEELGMYWDNLQSGWRYFDKVAITSTILQAFHEVGASTKEIDQIRKWMLLMKQSNDWGRSSLAADAVYALLSTGSQWIEQSAKPSITINGEQVAFSHIDEYVGYCRKTIPVSSGTTLRINREGASPAWGAVYCQYSAPASAIEANSITEMSISKKYFVYASDGSLRPVDDHQFHVGDKVQVRMVIKVNKDLDFVTVSDERGACFEPKDQTSGYRAMDGIYYFQETKDALTQLFFDALPKGTHIVSYDTYISTEGTFSAGIATAQCQYAPQISAHSAGAKITVLPR